jgi:hypothetical protein
MEQRVGLAAPRDRYHERVSNKLRGHLRFRRSANHPTSLCLPEIGEIRDPLRVRTLRRQLPTEHLSGSFQWFVLGREKQDAGARQRGLDVLGKAKRPRWRLSAQGREIAMTGRPVLDERDREILIALALIPER